MKAIPEVHLSDFRTTTFAEFREPPSSLGGFEQVRPNRYRKVYLPVSKRGRWIYRPDVLPVLGGTKSIKQIKGLMKDKTLDVIRDETDLNLKQLMVRAHLGDKRAAWMFHAIIVKSIAALNRLTDCKRVAVMSLAAECHDWPVMVSLNPNDINRAKEQLRELKIGTKSVIPTNPKQRINFKNFWTDLAYRALEICQINTRLVRQFERFGIGAEREHKTLKYWGTEVSATFYWVSDYEVILISDWQTLCGKLPSRITAKNFTQWWNAIKGCVLECWYNHRSAYQKALKEIGRAGESEIRRRNLAMTELRQAFKSLVGLRSLRAPSTV